MYSSSDAKSDGALLSADGKSLRPGIEELVHGLIAECKGNECRGDCSPDCKRFRVGALGDGRVLRLVPLVGASGQTYVLSVELDGNRNGLTRAARRFQLTRRESEVLALILDGASAAEIAGMLHIAENTVQGYFKRLLSKTNSRNRPAMVANVLDWDRSRRATSIAPFPNATGTIELLNEDGSWFKRRTCAGLASRQPSLKNVPAREEMRVRVAAGKR